MHRHFFEKTKKKQVLPKNLTKSRHPKTKTKENNNNNNSGDENLRTPTGRGVLDVNVLWDP
jgi:hypothetical protein